MAEYGFYSIHEFQHVYFSGDAKVPVSKEEVNNTPNVSNDASNDAFLPSLICLKYVRD